MEQESTQPKSAVQQTQASQSAASDGAGVAMIATETSATAPTAATPGDVSSSEDMAKSDIPSDGAPSAPEKSGKPSKPKDPVRSAVGHATGVVLGFFAVMALVYCAADIVCEIAKIDFDDPTVQSVINIVADLIPIVIIAAILRPSVSHTVKSASGVKQRGYVWGIRVHSRKAMTVGGFVFCLLLTMGLGGLGSAVSSGLQQLCMAVGLSRASANDAIANTALNSFMGIIASGVVAPVCEETLFRGLAMPGLERYGRPFAIITTAVLFGCVHMDLYQGVAVIIGGLGLGWVASEYSVVWSIVMHMFNNLVLAFGEDLLLKGMSGSIQTDVDVAIAMVEVVVLIVLLFVKRTDVRDYFAAHVNQAHAFRGWRSPLFLVVIILAVAVAIMNIVR